MDSKNASHFPARVDEDGSPQQARKIALLHLEDSPLDAELALARLRQDGLDISIQRVETREAFEEVINSPSHFDLVLSDYSLPSFDGMTALKITRAARPEVPFIFLSGVLGEENAIDSLKLGATDYVLKQRMDRLAPSIRRALAEASERRRRRSVEQALSRSEAQLRFTLDSVHIGYWEMDAATGQCISRSILHDKIFGYDVPPSSWSVDSFVGHVHPEDRALVAAQMGKANAPGGTCQFECRIHRQDGAERWIWVNGAYQHPESSDVEHVQGSDRRPIATASGLVMDVTDRKQIEQERERLLRSEREARADAERASRLKDDFLATLSHELRTPLNAVLGWAQLLKRGAIPVSEWPDTMEVIERNAKLQAQLVEDLLDMSRITSGKLRLEMQEMQVVPVVRAAVAAVRPGAESKGLTIVEQHEPGSHAIYGDPARIQQVIWNLLSNAVKFTPTGGKVEVSVSNACGNIQIRVTDTGNGIDPEFLPHVFDRFRQEDSSSARRHGGLGVGLSIVRHLVELHGGRVMADSKGPGAGAVFSVTLPAIAAGTGAVAIASDKTAPPALKGVKILVVDDEADAREYVRRLLQDCGAKVLTASRATEAMDVLKTERPSLLLSDIGMPEQDGYEFLRRVRKLEPGEGGDVKAVALTAYARPEDRQRSLEAGFQLHLSKPVDPSRLLAVVGQLVLGHPAH